MTECTISLRCRQELKQWTLAKAAKAGVAEGAFVRTVLEKERAAESDAPLTWDEILSPVRARARQLKSRARHPNPVIEQRRQERMQHAQRLR